MKEIVSLLKKSELLYLTQLYTESERSKKREILTFLIERDYDKTLWDSSARFIKSIDSNELRGFEKPLLIWLQDLNWPGFRQVIEVLADFPPETINRAVNETVLQIKEKDDELWLAGIKVLCNENEQLASLISKENKVELDKIDWI